MHLLINKLTLILKTIRTNYRSWAIFVLHFIYLVYAVLEISCLQACHNTSGVTRPLRAEVQVVYAGPYIL